MIPKPIGKIIHKISKNGTNYDSIQLEDRRLVSIDDDVFEIKA